MPGGTVGTTKEVTKEHTSLPDIGNYVHQLQCFNAKVETLSKENLMNHLKETDKMVENTGRVSLRSVGVSKR